MSFLTIPIWKEAPFVRLIIPLIAGIVVEWNFELPLQIYVLIIPISIVFIILFSLLKSFSRFKNYWLGGILINILFVNVGGVITHFKDVRHDINCITHNQTVGFCTVTLEEPLTEKEKTFKAIASVNRILNYDTVTILKGNIIIYFQKDSSLRALTYNNQICFKKKLQPIRNSGNPGAFDYQRYCAFQQIFYQVYLKPGEYVLIPGNNRSLTGMFIKARLTIVNILQTFIRGEKEAGLAEALLIGYKDDLDKNLVQSYSNTGVVHIIAISGLHVGLIYWLLTLLLRLLKSDRRLKWLKAVLIISGLWMFSLLTGGSASVCRSALMFSFIVTGENIGRKTNIYNSLAASAFLLLCYNPYWLWDAGFQLSYIAVLSIVVFMKPIYNWFYIKNKLLDQLWKMAAVSIAAQILTTPISIFHFQQFPNYFLITNIVAVPLSSMVVLAEIGLCTVSLVPVFARPLGNVTCWLIKVMNGFVDYINKMPFTVTTGLDVSLAEIIFMYALIFFACIYIFEKNKPALFVAICMLVCLCILRSCFSIRASLQENLVVYNIPHHQAIDLIKGTNCLFIGDSSIFKAPDLEHFILKPSRNKYGIKVARLFDKTSNTAKNFSIAGKHIVIVKSNHDLQAILPGSPVDIVILSGDPEIKIVALKNIRHCRKIIFDSSISQRLIDNWKVDCKKAGIEWYSVAENGAFILKPN